MWASCPIPDAKVVSLETFPLVLGTHWTTPSSFPCWILWSTGRKGGRDTFECYLPGQEVKKKPQFFFHLEGPLLLPLKTILRIITFIMSFIMGDFFVFKNKCWRTELYLVYGSRLHVNVRKEQLLYLRCIGSPAREPLRWGREGLQGLPGPS